VIDAQPLPGPLAGLRVLELADEKGPVLRQSCSPISGARCGQDRTARRRAEPPRRAVPRRHPPPRAQPVVLVLQHVQARHHPQSANRRRPPAFRALGGGIGRHPGNLPARLPGVPGAGLDYESLREQNSRLVMCFPDPFGQTGPWRDYLSSDLLHMAAGGEMASSGYDEADVPNAPPIAPAGATPGIWAGISPTWRLWPRWSIPSSLRPRPVYRTRRSTRLRADH